MKNLSISGLLAGVMLVIAYSLVPIFYKVIVEPPPWLSVQAYAGELSSLTLVFIAASLTALAIAVVRRQPPPRRAHIGTTFSLGLAGCIAAVYFVVVIIKDPAHGRLA